MSSTQQVPTRNLEKRKTRSLPYDREVFWAQFWWCLFWFILAIPLLVLIFKQEHSFESSVGVLTIAAVSGIGATSFEDGLGYTYPGEWWQSFWLRRKDGGIFLGGGDTPGEFAEGHEESGMQAPPRWLLRQPKPPIDWRLVGWPLYDSAGELDYVLGSFYDRKSNSDTVVIQGFGWHGISLDAIDRFTAEDMIIEALRQTANRHRCRYSLNWHIRPHNIEPGAAWLREHLDKSVLEADAELAFNEAGELQPQQATTEDILLANQLQLQYQNMVNGSKPTAVVTLSIKRPRFWPKGDVHHGRLTRRQIERSPLVRATQYLEAQLGRAGITDPQALDIDGLSVYVKTSTSIAGIHQWFRKLAEAQQTGIGLTEALWPWSRRAITAGSAPREHICIDGTYIRVYRVSGYDMERVTPGGLQGMYYAHDLGPKSSTGLTIAHLGKTVSATLESKRNIRRIVRREGWNRRKDQADVFVTEAEKRERHKLIERQNRLDFGGMLASSHNNYFVLLATSQEGLENAEEAFFGHASDAGVILKRITLESRQLRAVLSSFGPPVL